MRIYEQNELLKKILILIYFETLLETYNVFQ